MCARTRFLLYECGDVMEYDKNMNPIYKKEGTRLTQAWRKQCHLESFKLRNNGWWWFVDVPILKHKKIWLEQFRKGD